MMTNLLNGAHVANKLFSTIARLRLLLVMFVALSVSAEVWGAEMLIDFTGSKLPTSWSGTGAFDNNNNHYKTAAPGYALAANKYLETAEYTNVIALSFWGSTSNGGNGKSLTIEYKESDSNDWTQLTQISLAKGAQVKKTVDVIGLAGKTVKLKFSTTWNTGYLDDITIITADAAVSCDKKVSLTKGAETNGTFTLDKENGSYDNCDENFVVKVSNIVPKSSSQYCNGINVTGGNSSVTGPVDGVWTVTYAKENNITSTITPTYADKAPANISFENMGNPTPTTTGYYVGDTYTLPATNDYTCGDKTFVGWSTEIIENSPTKPTAATYFEPGASVTLAANQTFYAVFATSSGGDGEITTTKTETFENQTSYSSESNWKQALTWSASESKIGVEWTTYYGKILASDDYVELRTYSDRVMGYIWTSQKLKGIKSIQFNGWCVNSADKADMVVSYSTDNKTWNELGTHIAGTTSTSQSNIYTLPDYGVDKEYYISIDLQNATCPSSSNKKYRIDNIAFTFVEGSGTTYSDYTTSCSTEPSLCLIQKEVAY